MIAEKRVRAIPVTIRRTIFRRAAGRCERCKYQGRLFPHHKQMWSEGGEHTAENLEVLCANCHADAHEIGTVGVPPDESNFSGKRGPKPTPPDQHVIRRSFSCPRELWAEVLAHIPNQERSRVIQEALRVEVARRKREPPG